jgi:hypothetical protein
MNNALWSPRGAQARERTRGAGYTLVQVGTVPYVLSPDFLAFNWSARFGTFLQVINTGPTTLSAIQAASQSTFIDAEL